MSRFLANAGLLWAIALGLPLAAGIIARNVMFSPDEDDSGRLKQAKDEKAQPLPNPADKLIKPWPIFEGSPSERQGPE